MYENYLQSSNIIIDSIKQIMFSLNYIRCILKELDLM